MRRGTARAVATISLLPAVAIGSEDKLEEVVVKASFKVIKLSLINI